MRRLSSPIEAIRDHYQIVIVGSGYGGGIMASRLARAGRQVCLLERGKEFLPGEYPDTLPEITGEAQIDTPQLHIGSRSGLYDLRFNDDIGVFMGCGLGGTSLVNANVSLEPDSRVFDDPSWPQGLRDDVGGLLKKGYQRAREMLKPTPYPESGDFPPLKKLEALKDSAQALGGTFKKPPINVTFQDGVNHVGVEQHACEKCGDCVTGCNYGAKNTVLMNYLPDAHNHGAEIFTQVSVRFLERKNGRWLVHYQMLDSGREAFDAPTQFIGADIVVLSAGTLGSTEILLRSKEKGLGLSDSLGKKFGGNGDFLGFCYNADQEMNGIGFGNRSPLNLEPVGPTITGLVDMRDPQSLDGSLAIEEAAVPGGLGDLLPLGLSAAAKIMGKDTDNGVADMVRENQRELESLLRGPYAGAIRNTQTYLVMAHDDAGGRMELKDDRLRIRWPGAGKQPLFQAMSDALLTASTPSGGTYLPNPGWSDLTNQALMTVHPLGGCAMAERAEEGVVDHRGQVFSGQRGAGVHEGLIVADGSVIPRPLGVNPLLTISALAERTAALLAKSRNWNIDFSLPSHPPASAAAVRKMGVRFTETMRGHFSTEVLTDDYALAEKKGKEKDSTFQFILTIISDDVKRMIDHPAHEARAVGAVIAPALSEHPLTVTDGVFNLLIEDPDHSEIRQMRYRFKLTSKEGRVFHFYGFKVVRDDPGLDVWPDTTTLYITVYDGEDDQSPVFGRGILHIRPDDFMKQLTTMQVTNAPNEMARMKAMFDFGGFFNRQLYEVYGGIALKRNQLKPKAPPREKRPLRMDAPTLHPFQAADGTELLLTRYRGGSKGPVILSPGFGTSTLAYTIDTIETNFPEYLFAAGYDIWLFDYRASPALESAQMQFTLDDIATKDYPAAVAKVQEVTGASDVQMMVHCIGSMTFLMSVLAGKLKGKIRSAICSQLALFPLSPPLNEFKAGMRFGNLLTLLGQKTISTDFNADDWQDKLADDILKLFPMKGRFKSPVERRIQMIYGEVYNHDRINAATHAAMHEMFGVANMTTFNQIALLVRKKKILNAKRKDVYLPHAKRVDFPVTFIHGAENGLFVPEGTLETLRFLAANGDASLFKRIQFPRYAHMDFFIGEESAKDIFPTLLLELDGHN